MTEFIDEEREGAVRRKIIERLQDPDTKECLAETLTHFYVRFRESVTLAEVHSGGVRPEELTNEVYSCFHHICRGLAEEHADPIKEINKGLDSHLKRLALDAHKITIDKVLRESEPVNKALDLLASKEGLPKLIDGGFGKLTDIRKRRKELKRLYLIAKRAEGRGNNHDPLAKYHTALEFAMNLQNDLDDLTDNNQVFYAMKRDEEDRRNSRSAIRNSWFSNGIAVIAVIIAGFSLFVSSCREHTPAQIVITPPNSVEVVAPAGANPSAAYPPKKEETANPKD